jgi:hypothetical protein
VSGVKFGFTPEEAQPVALAVHNYYRKRKAKISIERAPWPDAPYRPTIVAVDGGKTILVEAQGSVAYSGTLKEFNSWLYLKRHYAELSIATSTDAVLPAGVLAQLNRDGVGLMIVDEEGGISFPHAAANPALVVTPDPTLKYGRCKPEVLTAVHKFNRVDRKDGLRDMCEVVERETARLAERASVRGFISVPLAAVQAQDWSSHINTLASQNACTPAHQPLLNQNLKDDCHSFRGARNLVDHKVKSKREDKKRQRQFAERMMQGPRLVAELLALQRRVR